MSRRSWARAWVLTAIGVAAFVGCNQILGNVDDDHLASSTDGGAGGQDAGATDGGEDGAADADAAADAAVDAPPACAMIPPDGGGCAPPRTLCGAGCFNLSCDPANCGACGHDCAGGSCGSGTCRPIALIAGEDGPQGLAVDDGGIYWADHGSNLVRVMALDGGSPSTIASGQAGPIGVTLTPTHVFWTNNGGGSVLFSTKVPFSPSLFATVTGDRPLFLVADATTLFWANQGTNDAGAGASLEGASLADGGILIQSDAGGAYPTDVALNGTYVFWTTASGIYDVPLGGGNTNAVVKDPEGPVAIAVTTSTVYWTNGAGNVQSRAIGTTTTPTLIHSGEAHATGMAVDGTYVYWVDQGAGSIFRAPLGATDETTTVQIASGQSNPYRIAVDARFVYWTNDVISGSVERLAK